MAIYKTTNLTKTMEFLKGRDPQIRYSISGGNTKLGDNFPSFSFPPVVSFYTGDRICTQCACNYKKQGKDCGGCYVLQHIYNRFKKTAACYEDNYWTYKHEPEVIFKGIEASMMTSRMFRMFTSGDIPDYEFLCREIEIVKRNPGCQVLQFTKKFDLVNEWIRQNGTLPKNLHMIFSGWKGLSMNNPFLLPECHIIYKDGSTTANDDKKAWLCSGNCTECYLNSNGCEAHNCFNVSYNEQILVHAH